MLNAIYIPASINMPSGSYDPNNNSGIHRLSHLVIPTDYQVFTGRFFDAIIDIVD